MKKIAAALPPEEEAPCPKCEKRLALCVCKDIAPIDNKIFVLILRHPQEKDEDLGTARLTTLQLKNSMLKTGLSWPSLPKILGKTVDPKRWGVLYLGTAKAAQPLPEQTLTVVNRKGNPSPDQEAVLEHMQGIIILDGSWAQAKALWWRNAWLLKCSRLILQPPRPSLYGKRRKEPRKESVSTIESAAYTLEELSGDNKLADKILVAFTSLLTKTHKQQ